LCSVTACHASTASGSFPCWSSAIASAGLAVCGLAKAGNARKARTNNDFRILMGKIGHLEVGPY
jgi:hypothetical protein